MDTINHEAAVQYVLDKDQRLSLPEKYNGLGYQNLISMIFKLIRFRDEWMQHGKSKKLEPQEDEQIFEPLHLVLIEEPEAHLHAQVQQVFIREAYKVLRNHENLETKENFITQLVISTHSNHIAHEVEFKSLRYFKKNKLKKNEISTSCVVNLSQVFGTETETTRFAIRYLKTTHCDLFFADAVILVEGPVEKILIPYFIKQHANKNLKACYISILEIGGSHAHTLRPLLESLGIITLIITDIDATDPKRNMSKNRTEKGKGLVTGNDTIKKWLPAISEIDKLLQLKQESKIHKEFPVRIAFQTSIILKDSQKDVEINPYTFEDCLVLENIILFQGIKKGTGLLAKMIEAAKEKNIDKSASMMYEAITSKGIKKAEFALDLLYLQEPSALKIPMYINEGLDWLESKLLPQKQK